MLVEHHNFISNLPRRPEKVIVDDRNQGTVFPYPVHVAPQKRLPRMPTLIKRLGLIFGLLLFLSRTSHVCCLSRSTVLVVGLGMLSFT